MTSPDAMRATRNKRKDAERRKRNALANLRGEPTGFINAAPVRAKVAALLKLGWSHEAIIRASGCTGTAAGLRLLASGTSRKAERKWVAVLDMPLSLRVPASVPDTCLVPTLGATRRVRALMAIGWRHEDISEFIGRASHHLSAGRYPKMTALDWRVVDAAYEKLSAGHGGSRKSMSRAKKSGYAPPMAWTDIDDPSEKPVGMRQLDRPKTDLDEAVVLRVLAGERLTMTAAERREIVARARAAGWSEERIYDVTGISKATDSSRYGRTAA